MKKLIQNHVYKDIFSIQLKSPEKIKTNHERAHPKSCIQGNFLNKLSFTFNLSRI